MDPNMYSSILQQLCSTFGVPEATAQDAMRRHGAELDAFLQPHGGHQVLTWLFQPTAEADTGESVLHVANLTTQTLTHKGVAFIRCPAVDGNDEAISCIEILPGVKETVDQLVQQLLLPMLRTEDATAKHADAINTLENMVRKLQSQKELVGTQNNISFPAPTDPNLEELVEAPASDPAVDAQLGQLLSVWSNTADVASTPILCPYEDAASLSSALADAEHRLVLATDVMAKMRAPHVLKVCHAAGCSGTKAQTALKQWQSATAAMQDGLARAADRAATLGKLAPIVHSTLMDGDLIILTAALPKLFDQIKAGIIASLEYSRPRDGAGLLRAVATTLAKRCRAHVHLRSRAHWDQDRKVQLRELEAIGILYMAFKQLAEQLLGVLCNNAAAKPQPAEIKHELAVLVTSATSPFHFVARRCAKFQFLFQNSERFSSLGSHVHVPGLVDIAASFAEMFQHLQQKCIAAGDVFESGVYPDFEADMLDFEVHVNDLELRIQETLRASFDDAISTEHALRLMRQYAPLLPRDVREGEVEAMYAAAFQRFAADLDAVQAIYERQKTNPPLIRGAPPVAGAILWARGLLQRIERLMRQFSQHQPTMDAKESRKTIKAYNRLAQTLLEFEVLWHTAWAKGTDAILALLQGPVLVAHPTTGQLHVNLNSSVLSMLQEARWMGRIGLPLPDSVRRALLTSDALQRRHTRLSAAVSCLIKEHATLPAALKPLMAPVMKHVNKRAEAGITAVCWTAATLDGFIHTFSQTVERAIDIYRRATDIHANRIEAAARAAQGLQVFDLTIATAQQDVAAFAAAQHRCLNVCTKTMQQREAEIKAACEDLIAMLEKYLQCSPPTMLLSDPSACAAYRACCWEKFHGAISTAVDTSLTAFANRFSQIPCRPSTPPKRGTSDAGVSASLPSSNALFSLQLRFNVPHLEVHPSLDEVNTILTSCARAALASLSTFTPWQGAMQRSCKRDTTRSSSEDDASSMTTASSNRPQSSGDGLECLSEAIERMNNDAAAHLSSLDRWVCLCSSDRDAACAAFLATHPSMEDIEARLREVSAQQCDIRDMPPTLAIGAAAAVELCTESFKAPLLGELAAWKSQLSNKIHCRAKEQVDSVEQWCKELVAGLQKELIDVQHVGEVVGALANSREMEGEIERRIAAVEEMYNLLLRHNVEVPKGELEALGDLQYAWRAVLEAAKEASDRLENVQDRFIEEIKAESVALVRETTLYRESWEANGPTVPGLAPLEAAARLERFEASMAPLARRREKLEANEALFGLVKTSLPDLLEVEEIVRALQQLYGLYTTVVKATSAAGKLPWLEGVQCLDTMVEEFGEYQSQSRRMPKQLREWPAYVDLRSMLEETTSALPLIQGLANPAVQNRHWVEVGRIVGTEFPLPSAGLILQQVLDAGLLAHRDAIQELCSGAVKEEELERKLRSVTQQWSTEALTFAEYKQRGPVVLKPTETAELLERLEDSTMVLGGLAASRYSAPFRPQLQALQGRLGAVTETIDLWLTVQAAWSYVEAVFSGGDLAKQLPAEAKRFQLVDRAFMKAVAAARDSGRVIDACCDSDALRGPLPALLEQLETCQKGLAAYLVFLLRHHSHQPFLKWGNLIDHRRASISIQQNAETKRSEFPRFYFVSDSTLLEILSLGSDPAAVVPHFQSGLFDSLAGVRFDPSDKHRIIEMFSREGERVPLIRPVDARGPVEVWLSRLVKGMQDTIRSNIKAAASAAADPALKVSDFVFSRPAQAALVGLQMRWTAETTAALEAAAREEKGALTKALRRADGTLRELVDCALRDDLTTVQRTALETCITVYIHQKEATEGLVARRVRSVRDFEWLRQCRVTWREDRNSAIVSICDVDLEYSYEYLGVKERLVITPLTDVCYVALTQALGMHLGGAPAGPAGTGKTETTKDLGATLGKYVVVFNCSDQMDYKGMGKIFKGLAQSGLWGCFDEFNRINLDVLSVCAQQVSCVLNALRERRTSFIFTDGSTVKLDPRVGFFITMNPGYAGRQELPENLKALFRGVTMMVPNREIIMKVKLASAGFQENEILAKKFNVLYALCEQQLSKQPHYDFGLRNILSVLRTAGSAKRANPNMSETELIMRTLRDMNISKFVAEDVPLFLDLIEDLFPKQRADRAPAADVASALAKVCSERGLQPHPAWMQRCLQLYDTTLVRHGVMVVGPSGTGKTTAVECLAAALTSIGQKTVIWRMNPKAITAPQMFGRMDAATGDWTDGIFATLWRRAARAPKGQHTWIVLDGPVDAVWIENLNTVLDDNKVLTLANGDRVLMTPHMRLFFEAENLNNASPATVSRAGIIYFSESELGWQPAVHSWLAGRPERQAALLRPCFERLVSASLEFVRTSCQPAMRNDDACLVGSLITLLAGVLGPSTVQQHADDDDDDVAARGTPGAAERRISAAHLQAAAIQAAQIRTNAQQGGIPLSKHAATLFERHFLFCLAWSVGGLLNSRDRHAFDTYLRKLSPHMPPKTGHSEEEETIYDYHVNESSGEWQLWADIVPSWEFPSCPNPRFSQLIVPMLDTVRYERLLSLVHAAGGASLLVGGAGTAKTTIVSQFLSKFDSDAYIAKTITFSSLTTPGICQAALEGCVEKRQGRTYGPPGGKTATIFLDDLGMPSVNQWGDQVTSELVRQILAQGGIYSTEKPVGELKLFADLRFVAAMNTPGPGRNDIPARLKRQFCIFYVPSPTSSDVTAAFGRLMLGHFSPQRCPSFLSDVSKLVVPATMQLWTEVQAKMLPTPSKMHYLFTMRDLSKVLQGIMLADLTAFNPQEIKPGTTAKANAGGFASNTSFIEANGNELDANFDNRLQTEHNEPTCANAAATLAEVPNGENTANSPGSAMQNAGSFPASAEIPAESIQGEAYLVALWAHECRRVFADKLIDAEEKTWIDGAISSAAQKYYGPELAAKALNSSMHVRFASFLRDAPIDQLTGEPSGPRPNAYESAPGGNPEVRARIIALLTEARASCRPGEGPPDLVLFDDAVDHVLRLARVMSMDRGSALLVGIGGSGKQSVARVAAQLVGATCYKMTTSKSYGVSNLLEDLKTMYKQAALRPSPVVFLITEADVREDVFLEYINQVLMTGEVAGLFPRDELEAIFNDLRPLMRQESPGLPDTWDNVYSYFINRVRDRLHLVLCFSPVGLRFSRWCQQFPGLISCCTIDWFLPWPQEALLAVSEALLGSCPGTEHLPQEHLSALRRIMAQLHARVSVACQEYLVQYRRTVHVTPKSYLSALNTFQELYRNKFAQLTSMASALRLGLAKIAEAKEAVGVMRGALTVQNAELAVAGAESERLLGEISQSTAAAEKEKSKVAVIVEAVRRKAAEIAEAKASAEADLAAAQPALEAALAALNSITSKDIVSLKALKSPPDVIKRIFDCVLLLRHYPINPTAWHDVKGSTVLLGTYDASVRMMGESGFLQALLSFPKESINDETVELLRPYFAAPDFNYASAKKASGNVAGLCNWAEAMCKYHEVAKMVEPKIIALQASEIELAAAEAEKQSAEADLARVQAEVDAMQARLEAAIAHKQALKADAEATQTKMENAMTLMGALGGEESRWKEQSGHLARAIERLTGDCLIAASFLSYLGPFNRSFRDTVIAEVENMCVTNGLPFTTPVDVAGLLADEAETGQWAVEGLPTDPLSIQNGLLVTRAPRAALLIDPQGQGRTWLMRREGPAGLKITSLGDKHFRSTIEEAVTQGLPLLIENVEEYIDPALDPLLERTFVRRGDIMTVQLGDKELDVGKDFRMFLTCRLPNPRFSPETFARTSAVDFTVTPSGLEDQLLGELVLREKRGLEEQRRKLVEEVQACRRRVAGLEADLLKQLSESSGNLLEDSALVDVLAATKQTALDVGSRMSTASETRSRITHACEEYRPAAHRAMLLYFLISDFSSVNCMYQFDKFYSKMSIYTRVQTSLAQFMALYESSIGSAEQCPDPADRVVAISNHLTNSVYQYVQQGLFERHKLIFAIILANTLNVDAGTVAANEVETFLVLGRGFTARQAKAKPKDWIPASVWQNVLVLSERHPDTFRDLPELVTKYDAEWRAWYAVDDLETLSVPRLGGSLSYFMKLCIVRAFREDRALISAANYVSETIGQNFVQSPPTDVERVWSLSSPTCPIVYLLSAGADPTRAIEDLAKRRRIKCSGVSMGQGQEVVARRLVAAAATEGQWVLLQNAHLGLGYVSEVERMLAETGGKGFASGFRLWITAEPHPEFPIGLLHSSIKVTNEAPVGLRACLRASYLWITQDTLDAVPRAEWRQLLFALCFLHAVVQERRRFGPLGWNVPYEFNSADLVACVYFLQNHMQDVAARRGSAPDWQTVRYMISTIQYGGRITDNQDREIMDAYAAKYFDQFILERNHCLFQEPGSRGMRYCIPDGTDIEMFREAVDALPLQDHPELFGLHTNAELAFRTLQFAEAVTVIESTRPRGGGPAAGGSVETVVAATCESLLSKLPPIMEAPQVHDALNKLGGGASAPLNIHLRQEIERLNRVTVLVEETLRTLKLACAGTVTLNDDLLQCMDALFVGRTPVNWLKVSWEHAALSGWFSGLVQRHEQLKRWLDGGRPKSFWLPGFFNPQGFLTAVKQEVTRKHAKDNWALDDVIVTSEVTRYADPAVVKEGPSEGAYIHGLYLEGAAWSMKEGKLVDAEPRKLFAPLPVMHITAARAVDRKTVAGIYEAPCYRVKRRTGANFVSKFMLKTDQDPTKWVLRGTAILCSIE